MRILLLMLGTLIWGFGFAATRWTLAAYDPTWSNALRFVFAGAMVFPVLLWKKQLRLTLPVGVCSLLLLAGLHLQTVGIHHTTLAKSGFFTTFYAIFTPILMRIWYKQKFRPGYWVLLGLAVFGVALLCDLSLDGFNMGDAFVLCSAFVFSVHILAIDKLAQDVHPVYFNLQQCLYIGLLGIPFALVVSGVPSLSPLLEIESLWPPGVLAGFVFLSLFSSIGAFSIQVYAQQGTPAHVVSLIFLTESVFGALFGYLFFNEKLSHLGMAGAGLVLASVVLVPIFTQFEKAENIPINGIDGTVETN